APVYADLEHDVTVLEIERNCGGVRVQAHIRRTGFGHLEYRWLLSARVHLHVGALPIVRGLVRLHYVGAQGSEHSIRVTPVGVNRGDLAVFAAGANGLDRKIRLRIDVPLDGRTAR